SRAGQEHMVQVLPIHALHHFGLARPEGDGLDAALASEQVRERGAPGAPADHGDLHLALPPGPSAECGVRHAELTGQVRSRTPADALDECAIHSALRIPHSAFDFTPSTLFASGSGFPSPR